jgi:signal transduction histidine kinase
MKEHYLEPGLLSIFRIYVVLRLLAILAAAEFFFLEYGLDPVQIPYAVLFVADIVFLLVYLSWSWLRRKLGRIYLPIALLVASIGPIVEGRYLFIVYDATYEARFWLVFPFLTVPLILTAWQYRFQSVLGFCVGTAFLEGVLIRISPYQNPERAMADMGSVVVRSVFFILIGYIMSHLMDAQRQQRQALAEANRKVISYAATLEQLAVSQERNRLARELHDTLAHALSGLAVQLDAIATLWDPIPPRAHAMLERALSITRIGLDETRRALQALRATPLDDMGLALAIRNLAETTAARGALSLALHVPESVNNVSPEVEQCYYRVAQEALENVIRHAEAHKIEVLLQQRARQLVLEVSDDGQGFDTGAVASQGRLGIRGMEERAALIGATLRIDSRSGEGTTIRLSYETSQ